MRASQILIMVILFHLPSMPIQAQNMKQKPVLAAVADLQGHRGCRGLMPENTIPAMVRALELGVNTLEMDVVITADSQVVLSHEPFFNHEISTMPETGARVTVEEEKGLNIYKMTYAEVKRFDVGTLPHPRFPEQKKMPAVKPLLADVILAVKEWCSAHNRPMPFFNIETKCTPATDGLYHPGPVEFSDLLIGVIKDQGITEKVIIQSFDFRTLKYIKSTYPGIYLAALIEGDDPHNLLGHIDALGFVPDIYSPAYERVNENLVGQCRELGMRLVPWTVNDPAIANSLKQLGVDAIITDYPDRIR